MNIVFSILHYIDFNTTRNCIDSILKLEPDLNDNIYVVVVDNGSNNNSGNQLKELYKDNRNVVIICNVNNVGFAQGNNIGFKYAKEELKPDVLLVINNDIIIEQENFISKLKDIVLRNEDYAVIAPDVVNLNDEHQNPYRPQRLSRLGALILFFYSLIYYVILRIPLMNSFFLKIIERKHNKKNAGTFDNKKEMISDVFDIVPHGAAVIFTHMYICDNDYVFDPRTFLYAEEDLLMEHLVKTGKRTYYNSALQVKHLEDVSTSMIVSTPLSKRLFMSRHKVYSIFILLKERFAINCK